MNTVLSKLILCCTLILFGLNLQAANYYFSSEIGDDSRSSSQAQSANSPWKSIDKLNAIIPSLNPGDKIFFRRGDVFYGSILINTSGTAGSPITFGAYGSGPDPVITSLLRLSNWQSVGNGVYEAGDSRLPNHKVNMVTINDIPQEMGRYPNSNTAEKGYLTYESHSGNRSISDYQLSSSPNWTGGEVVIRKVYWITDRHRITSHSGNTVNYSPNPDTSYEPRAGYGYYIQDHPSTLDRYGEWYYNPLNKKLRVYFGGDPGNTDLEVSTFDFIVYKTGNAKYITFENLHFKGANRNAFQFVGGNDIKIINCKMDLSGENGLFIEGVSNFQVENSQVSHSNNIGMNIRNSQSAVIRGNRINSTYLFPGHGRSGDNVGLAIFTDGDDNLIEYNEIKKTGYIGIRFGGNDSQVRYNYIDGFCYTKNDGGGIYTYQHKNTRFKNRKITNNIILNGLGVKEGTTIENFVSKPQAEGIYLDDNVTDVEISGNTVGHMATKGIYLHNTDNIRVINNTVYDAENLIFLRNDLMGNPLANTLIDNNKLLAKDASQNFVYVHSIYNDVAELARFNNNQYSAPFSDNFRFRVRYNANSSYEARKFFDLSGWQRAFNNDWNSKTGEPMENLYQVTEKIGSNRYANGTFDRDVNLISCSDCSNSWDSGKLDGGSLKISTKGTSQTTLRTGQLKKGKYYMLKFTGLADKNIPVSFYLRQGTSPWFLLSHKHKVGLNWQKGEKEILIQALADMDESRLVMEIETGESGVLWMDNLEFYEVEANVTKPEDKVLFEKNPSRQKQSFSTLGGFVGLLNQYLSQTLSIEPYSSILLLKSGSGIIEKVLASPTVKLTKPESNYNTTQGETIMIEADASISDGEIAQVDFYNGSNKLGSISSPPYAFAWKNPPSGSFEISAVATADNGQKASSSPVAIQINATTSSAQPTATNFFINAGSNEDAELSGLKFSGENQNNQFYTTSKEYEAINASSYALFQSERFGPTLGYNIPVPNGTYYVYTFHNELWFGKEGPSSRTGQRVFNIAIENNTLKRDFDLYKENQNKPMVLTFEGVKVSDGNLNLYLSASTDNASISGIVISEKPINFPSDLTDGVPSTENKELATYSDYLIINTGSREDVSYDGKTFVSDYKTSYFASPSANFNLTVAGEPLFQTERYAKNMSIRIPLENGTYQVKTYHNELWFGSFGPKAAAGNRVFDISIEGELKKDNFDIYAEKGNSPTVLTFDNIEVTDGALNLDLNASKDNATISGLLIAKSSGGSIKPGISKPNQSPIFLNAGTYEAAEHNNQTYVGDRNTSYPGTSKINFNYSVGGSKMFLTERYSNNLHYSIPVENGTYTVVTYHNELWFGSFGPAARSGNRVFNIYIEDKRVKSNFDIYTESNNNPTTLTFRSIAVTDGILDISLAAVTDNATLSGIAVIPEGEAYASSLRLATEDQNQILDIQASEPTTLAETKVYPNPASHQTSLTLGRDVAISEIYLQSTSGALIKSIDPKTASDGFGTYTIPLEGIQSGVYVLTVSNGRDWIKKIKLIVE
ncbi:malectin domain-containing carbohydrate-binding protein [Cyclobacterium sp.]|uniref:malectin domain-containing carbohydrate-binding protein n=1 Tax=Cyclobacterium sp. TaxID=1966343 RepID=UPI0019CD9F36|nr:malectin domain-containing carbohydrate-binding protein [Cyclobacterium sp.]MBD3630196.1 right-handed parallel beta-helix repeat-containing protein [Cyclobacterium sp.]